jgi:hypothetical protein
MTMRVKLSGERCYELELTASDDAYVRTVVQAAGFGGCASSTETVLLDAVLVGLRVVAADILGRVVLRSGGDGRPPGDRNPTDA